MEDERGRKIVSNLKSAFLRDPHIDEYDFLPVLEPVHNCNPVVLVDHKLGLELWAAKLMFHSAYKRLFAWRTRQAQARGIEPSEVANLTRAVLLFNPDCATAWNTRKEFIQSHHMSLVEDLRLGALILTRFPKSAETFAHRKWLLQKMKDTLHTCVNDSGKVESHSCAHELECASKKTYQQHNTSKCKTNSDLSAKPCLPHSQGNPAAASLPPSQGSQRQSNSDNCCKVASTSSCISQKQMQEPLTEEIKEVIRKEMEVSALAAMHYPNNYNAWCHRIWVLQHIACCHTEILQSELKDTQDWLWQHVSDHSGFHYRQFLLNSLLRHPFWTSESSTSSSLASAELEMTSDLITSYPGHEAVWYHRRFVLHLMASTLSLKSCDRSIPASPDHQTKKSRLDDSPNRDDLLKREMDFSQEMASSTKDEWQKSLAYTHEQWLKNVLTNCINSVV